MADEMGLGKTLSMIALIASDKDRPASQQWPRASLERRRPTRSTLLVVPVSGKAKYLWTRPGSQYPVLHLSNFFQVLEVWEKQLKT